jgi:hypothetical protein
LEDEQSWRQEINSSITLKLIDSMDQMPFYPDRNKPSTKRNKKKGQQDKSSADKMDITTTTVDPVHKHDTYAIEERSRRREAEELLLLESSSDEDEFEIYKNMDTPSRDGIGDDEKNNYDSVFDSDSDSEDDSQNIMSSITSSMKDMKAFDSDSDSDSSFYTRRHRPVAAAAAAVQKKKENMKTTATTAAAMIKTVITIDDSCDDEKDDEEEASTSSSNSFEYRTQSKRAAMNTGVAASASATNDTISTKPTERHQRKNDTVHSIYSSSSSSSDSSDDESDSGFAIRRRYPSQPVPLSRSMKKSPPTVATTTSTKRSHRPTEIIDLISP